MHVLARSLWNHDQIKERIDCGADGVEVYLNKLTGDFFDTSTWSLDLLEKVYAIHMPVIVTQQGQKVTVEDYGIDDVNGWNILPTICEKASMIARRVNHKVCVIVRIHTSTADLKRLDVYSNVIDIVKRMSSLHSNIDLCIENTAKTLHQPLTNIDVYNDARAENVGCCLDVCNSLMVTQQTRLLSSMGVKFMPYEAYFKRMRDCIKIMHLSNAVDNGSGYGINNGHDCAYSTSNKEDMESLERTMWLYKDHAYTCDICITSGLNNIDDFSSTMSALHEVSKRLNIIL